MVKNGQHEWKCQNQSRGVSWVNLDNDGTVQVDVTVNSTNTAVWTLAASPGHNQFNFFAVKKSTSKLVWW